MDSASRRSGARPGAQWRRAEPLQAAGAVRDRVREMLRHMPPELTDEVMDLLQEGYAHALTLEGSCRRSARELAQLRADATDPERAKRLAERLRVMRRELRGLRSTLAVLRARAEERAR